MPWRLGRQPIGGQPPAGIGPALRIVADLPALGRIHTPQPDADAVDFQGVAIDDRRPPFDSRRLRRAADEKYQCGNQNAHDPHSPKPEPGPTSQRLYQSRRAEPRDITPDEGKDIRT